MKWVDCQRYCTGQCPCPDPPWLWNCNQVPPTPKKRNPQKRWIVAPNGMWILLDATEDIF